MRKFKPGDIVSHFKRQKYPDTAQTYRFELFLG